MSIITYSNILATQSWAPSIARYHFRRWYRISYLGWLGVVRDITTVHIQVQLTLPCILGNISKRLKGIL
jgi:hypothetical protein